MTINVQISTCVIQISLDRLYSMKSMTRNKSIEEIKKRVKSNAVPSQVVRHESWINSQKPFIDEFYDIFCANHLMSCTCLEACSSLCTDLPWWISNYSNSEWNWLLRLFVDKHVTVISVDLNIVTIMKTRIQTVNKLWVSFNSMSIAQQNWREWVRKEGKWPRLSIQKKNDWKRSDISTIVISDKFSERGLKNWIYEKKWEFKVVWSFAYFRFLIYL